MVSCCGQFCPNLLVYNEPTECSTAKVRFFNFTFNQVANNFAKNERISATVNMVIT